MIQTQLTIAAVLNTELICIQNSYQFNIPENFPFVTFPGNSNFSFYCDWMQGRVVYTQLTIRLLHYKVCPPAAPCWS